jgi:tetratricopeptide (TPR) repeat protein
MGRAYLHVAEVQGVPTNLNLGEFSKAGANLKKADGFIETVLASRPRSRAALLDSAEIAQARMILAESEHQRQDALIQARKAGQRLDQLMRGSDPSQAERHAAERVYGNVALANMNLHQFDDAVRYARRGVDLARPSVSDRYQLTSCLSVLSNALRYQGDLEGGLQAIREARSAAEATKYPNDTVRTFSLYAIYLREGLILGEDGGINLDRPEDAVAALKKAFDITADVAAKDRNDFTSRSRVGTAARELGNILRYRDPQRAIEVYDVGIERLGEIQSNLKARRDQAVLMASSAYALRRVHRGSEARKRIDDAFAILKETKDYPADSITLGSEAYTVLCARADDYAEGGDGRRAVEIYEQLLNKITASKPDPLTDLRDAAKLSQFYAALAGLYRRTHDSAKAENMDAQRRGIWRYWDRKLPNNPFVSGQIAAAAVVH